MQKREAGQGATGTGYPYPYPRGVSREEKAGIRVRGSWKGYYTKGGSYIDQNRIFAHNDFQDHKIRRRKNAYQR